MDPPLLGQLDDDPDEGRRAARAPWRSCAAGSNGCARPRRREEVLERVGEHEQQPARVRSARTASRRRAGRGKEPARAGTRPGRAICASSRCRRSPGSRRRAPCRTTGIPGNGSLVTHEKIVWSAASSTSAARIAGSGYLGMKSGIVKRSRTTTTTTVSAPIGFQRNPIGGSQIATVVRRYVSGRGARADFCASKGALTVARPTPNRVGEFFKRMIQRDDDSGAEAPEAVGPDPAVVTMLRALGAALVQAGRATNETDEILHTIATAYGRPENSASSSCRPRSSSSSSARRRTPRSIRST